MIHDGIDTELWRRRLMPRRIGGEAVTESTRIVTYMARGLEVMSIAATLPNARLAVVGSDRVYYGNDADMAARYSLAPRSLRPTPR